MFFFAQPNAFATVPFAATGTPTPRTMADRLAEIKNVLDFGADPTNIIDSTPAFQAAVDAVVAAGRGTVFIPLGFYKITSPGVTLNFNGALSISFVGEGAGSHLSGNFAGFIIDRHLVSPSNVAGIISFEKLFVENGNSSAGSGAIRLGSTKQGSFRDVTVSGVIGITTEDSAGNSSQNILLESCKIGANGTGSRGLIIGGGGAMYGCDFVGSEIGVLAYGNGFYMAGNRIEDCITGYQLGLDSAGNSVGMSAFTLSGSTEGNVTGIDMAGPCVGGFIGPMSCLGHITSGPSENIPTDYGLRIRADCAQSCVFYNVVPNSYFGIAAVSIANATSRANNVFISSDPSVGFGGGAVWVLPTNAYTMKFVQCNTQPVWTFAQLPTGGNALEGDEFNISDSNTAVWGATAAGGGSNRVMVRNNGTNYTVVGK